MLHKLPEGSLRQGMDIACTFDLGPENGVIVPDRNIERETRRFDHRTAGHFGTQIACYVFTHKAGHMFNGLFAISQSDQPRQSPAFNPQMTLTHGHAINMAKAPSADVSQRKARILRPRMWFGITPEKARNHPDHNYYLLKTVGLRKEPIDDRASKGLVCVCPYGKARLMPVGKALPAGPLLIAE